MFRYGLGWRKEIAVSILRNLDQFQILEVIIDDYLDCSAEEIEQLRFLESRVPLTFHGIGLGLASSREVNSQILKKFSKFLRHFPDSTWSEHIAFVRGDGIEIHHLAQPPMNLDTLKGLKRNLEIVFDSIGSYPILENPASLISPPNSIWREEVWMQKICEETPVKLLLDLHNLYANSVNFSFDPYSWIDSIPSERIAAIHLAGGKRIGERKNKILDSHLHPVPEEVYQLLAYTAKRVQQNLDIVLERDGKYPPISELIQELGRAKSICGRTFSGIP